MRRPPPLVALVVLGVIWVCTASAIPVRAAPAPDSARLDQMRSDASRWNRFRIVTAQGRRESRAFRVDSLGFVLEPAPGRAAIVQDPAAGAPEPKRIHWTEIESIEGTRSHAGRGFVEGGLIGGLVALGTAAVTVDTSSEDALGVVSAFPIGFLIGGLIGASLESSSGWHRVYP